MLAIQVLVQTVVIACAVLEDQRCWLILSRLMTALYKFGIRRRIANVNSHRLVPTISDRNQMRIKRRAKSCNQTRQWIAEIAILSTSEAMALHHNLTAKDLFLVIKGTDLLTIIWSQNTLDD